MLNVKSNYGTNKGSEQLCQVLFLARLQGSLCGTLFTLASVHPRALVLPSNVETLFEQKLKLCDYF